MLTAATLNLGMVLLGQVADLATARSSLGGAGSTFRELLVVTIPSRRTEEWSFSGLDPNNTSSKIF